MIYSNDALVPSALKNVVLFIGPLHISLNARECLLLNFHQVFADLYSLLFWKENKVGKDAKAMENIIIISNIRDMILSVNFSANPHSLLSYVCCIPKTLLQQSITNHGFNIFALTRKGFKLYAKIWWHLTNMQLRTFILYYEKEPRRLTQHMKFHSRQKKLMLANTSFIHSNLYLSLPKNSFHQQENKQVERKSSQISHNKVSRPLLPSWHGSPTTTETSQPIWRVIVTNQVLPLGFTLVETSPNPTR